MYFQKIRSRQPYCNAVSLSHGQFKNIFIGHRKVLGKAGLATMAGESMSDNTCLPIEK